MSVEGRGTVPLSKALHLVGTQLVNGPFGLTLTGNRGTTVIGGFVHS